jgi:hypothetical protein
MRWRGLGAVICALAPACSSAETAPSRQDAAAEFTPFFDGVDLDGFEFVGISPDAISIENGELRCKCQTNGYFYRNDVYRNFVLALGFRFERPADLAPGADAAFQGNSGVFVYLSPPHQVWPSCLEVQGSYQETGDIFRLPGILPGNDSFDVAALNTARRPVGDWNDLRITSTDGALEVELNQVVVNRSTPDELSEGLIALESEGAEVHFRDVRVKRLE